MKRTVLLTATAVMLAFAGTAGAADDTINATARCSRKWVVITHGTGSESVYMSRDNEHFSGPIVLDSFVPDVGGGYAHVDYDVDIWLQIRDGDSDGARVLASGKVHTPICGPIPPSTTAPPAPVVEAPTTTAPSSKLVSVDTGKAVIGALEASRVS